MPIEKTILQLLEVIKVHYHSVETGGWKTRKLQEELCKFGQMLWSILRRPKEA